MHSKHESVRAYSGFDDLTLRFEKDPQGERILVCVEDSLMGSSSAVPFELVGLGRDLSIALDQVEVALQTEDWGWASSTEPWQESQADPQSAVSLAPESLGRMLFDSLFVGPIRERFLTCLAVLEREPHRGLRIRLKMCPEEVGAMSSLPWELLYRSETRDYLSRNVRTPIVRHLDVYRAMPAPRNVDTLRVLVVLSSPIGVDPIGVEVERRRLEETLGQRSGIELRFLATPSLQLLRDKVRDEPFDVLHFVGHGCFDQEGRGALLFEDAMRRVDSVTGSVLAENLKGFESVQLVFLNACEAARLPSRAAGLDPYEGTASALVMAGIPAVVAMQLPITDDAAVAFSAAFYGSISRGDALENAVTEGRLALYTAEPGTFEWATPVLFLGCAHGRLFLPKVVTGQNDSIELKSAEPVRSEAISSKNSDLEEMLELLDLERYEEARHGLEALCENDSTRADVFFYLAISRLGGKRPRSARPETIRKIEADLWQAARCCRGEEPAHLWLFSALLKHDYYRLNGLRAKPPSVQEFLAEADVAVKQHDPLRYLDEHVKTSSNAVRFKLILFRQQSLLDAE